MQQVAGVALQRHASRLERNLNLALQVLEITDRVVICLNLMDEAGRHGLKIDDRRLQSIDIDSSLAPHFGAHYSRGNGLPANAKCKPYDFDLKVLICLGIPAFSGMKKG